jgi:hypothetical protein
MKDNQIIKEPSVIEKYVMCLEEQITTLTNALHASQKELKELKCRVDDNMPVKPYHDIAIEGSNLSDRFLMRIVSPQEIDRVFVRDYLISTNSREFCMVYSHFQTLEVLEVVGIFMDYVYLSNAFNRFYDKFRVTHGDKFRLNIFSLDRVSDYMCARHNVFKKQNHVEHYSTPRIYKYNEETKSVECLDEYLDEDWPELHPYYMAARLINPIITFDGME